jgi:hypothetical protein
MMRKENLIQMGNFLNEFARIKIKIKCFLNYLLTLVDELDFKDILDFKDFKDLIDYNFQIFSNYLEKLRASENKFEIFIEDNPDILKFLEREGFDCIIFNSPMGYSSNLCELCNLEEFLIDEFYSSIEEDFNQNNEEFEAILNLRIIVSKKIDKFEICYMCLENIGILECKSCSKNVCASHCQEGFCLNCVKEILRNNGRAG